MQTRPGFLAKPLTAAILTSLLAGAMVFAATPITENLKDFNGTIDKDKNLHLEATAEITAPEQKVFDALSHPELTAKEDPNVRSVKVVSQDGNSKVVEFTGTAVPIPNAPQSLKVKLVPDQASQSVKVESVDSPILRFKNEYQLSPSKGGNGTIVKYTSLSNDVSKEIGMQIPDGMRKQIALQTFMQQLHSIGNYIEDGASKVAAHK